MAHSIQYLWVTAYYASNSDSPEPFLPFFGKTLLVGAALTTLPALVFAPDLLGTVSYAAGFSTVLFSVINIHHFILDGAIWKLRDGRVAQVLLRTSERPELPEPATRASGRGWLRPIVWTACGLFMVIELANVWEREFGVRRALFAERMDRAADAVIRLNWIGREDHDVYRNLADAIARREARVGRERGLAPDETNFDRARAYYEQSIAVYPTSEAWLGLGNIYGSLGDHEAAREAYAAALAIEPQHFRVIDRLGELWLKEGNLARARQVLTQAAALAPQDKRILEAMERLVRAERSASRAALPSTRPDR